MSPFPIADIALAWRVIIIPTLHVDCAHLARDSLFALFQLALPTLPGALLVAGPDWQAGPRGLPTKLRQSVSFGPMSGHPYQLDS
jgi:hypothetical protein